MGLELSLGTVGGSLSALPGPGLHRDSLSCSQPLLGPGVFLNTNLTMASCF